MAFSHAIEDLRKGLEQGLVKHAKEPRYDESGRRRLTILETLAPIVYKKHGYARYCPPYLMPIWMACLTQHLDDFFEGVAWTLMVREYLELASRFNRLDDDDWHEIECGARKMVVRHAEPYAPQMANEHAYPIIDRWLLGTKPHPDQWNRPLTQCREISAQARVGPRYAPHQPRYLAHQALACIINGKSSAAVAWGIGHLCDMYYWVGLVDKKDPDDKKQKSGWSMCDEVFKMLKDQIAMKQLPYDEAPIFDLYQETKVNP